MSEKDWDDFPKEELLGIAPALIYLKRAFGTEVGNPNNPQPSESVEQKKEKPDVR
jgi:hypothetical protein